MSNKYEKGRKALEELIQWYNKQIDDNNRNEYTTRLHLINHLVLECLGWNKEDCKAEESCNNQYTDYSLFCPYRAFIIEAKREGIYFELPVGIPRLTYSIKSLIRDNKEIGNAIKQAMQYCQDRGTPLGAVFNGHQIICFVACRTDGKPPIEGRALVFSSLQKMLDNFLDMWKYLSKLGISTGNLYPFLLGSDEFNIPEKLSASISLYPGTKIRNILQTDLQIVGQLVIEDVVRTREIETDFIKACFCSSGALSRYALISKTILEHRYASLFNAGSKAPTVIPATTKKGISKEMLAESLSSRPIILLGDVGVGKTMFIKHLIKVTGADVFENAITLYFDLGSKAALSKDLRTFFLGDLENQLLHNYDTNINQENFVRAVYHGELLRFGKSIYGPLKESDPKSYRLKEIEFLENKLNDKEIYFKGCLDHISKGRKKQIVLFLDNADQRSETIQQAAFFIAQEISVNWPVTVFLAMRPETYHKSRKSGALTGYHPKAFTISPPRIDEVIIRRLEFASKIAKGELEIKSLPNGLSVKLNKLNKYLDVLLYSFRNNYELIEFIDNVCKGDVRTALEFISIFIGSGHVDTQKILDIEEKNSPGEHYYVPLHEFLRAIIYGDNKYYNPQTSPITNLFDISTGDAKEYFLLSLLIDFINRQSSSAGSEGFVDISTIYRFGQKIGFTPTQIDNALGRALRKKLLESEKRTMSLDALNRPKLFRVTTVGAYHIKKLIRSFVYIDAVVIDTPILDDKVRSTILNVDSINDRLLRADIFCDYLNTQWQLLQLEQKGFDWDLVASDIKSDIYRIDEKIKEKASEGNSSQ